MKRLSVFTLFLVFTLSSTFVMANPRDWRPRADRQWGERPAMFSQLALSAEQKEKMTALQESFMKEISPLRFELTKKRLEMRLLWMEENPDSARIKAQQKAISELRGKLQEKALDRRLAMRNILTPEQRSRIKSWVSGRARQAFRGRPEPGVNPMDRPPPRPPRW